MGVIDQITSLTFTDILDAIGHTAMWKLAAGVCCVSFGGFAISALPDDKRGMAIIAALGLGLSMGTNWPLDWKTILG
jgi:hypothetical protein